MPKRTSNPEYRRRRAEVLEGNPLCHWCKKAPATEADHLLPYDLVGDDTPIVASCKPCNAQRGAIYLAQKKAHVQHQRNEALGLQDGKTTAAQDGWIRALGPHVECYLWRPSDIDFIAQRLSQC